MGDRLVAAVVSTHQGKLVVPQHIVTLLACAEPEEAHYVAALINSTPFQFSAHAYSQSGGKSFATPQILENVRIPRFDVTDSVHRRLADLSQEAHTRAPAAYAGDADARAALARVELAVDEAAAALWQLTGTELAALRRNLAELHGGAAEPQSPEADEA